VRGRSLQAFFRLGDPEDSEGPARIQAGPRGYRERSRRGRRLREAAVGDRARVHPRLHRHRPCSAQPGPRAPHTVLLSTRRRVIPSGQRPLGGGLRPIFASRSPEWDEGSCAAAGRAGARTHTRSRTLAPLSRARWRQGTMATATTPPPSTTVSPGVEAVVPPQLPAGQPYFPIDMRHKFPSYICRSCRRRPLPCACCILGRPAVTVVEKNPKAARITRGRCWRTGRWWTLPRHRKWPSNILAHLGLAT
jgi:hypothetical protein